MQIRKPHLLLLFVVAIVGCAPAPEDPLFAFGSLEAPDGTPTTGTLSVLRADCGDFGCDMIVPGPGNPGLPFLEPEYRPFTEVTTDADGTWMLELTRFDATEYTQQGAQMRMFKIVAQPDATLPPVEATYRYESADVDLPPLRQWNAQASVTLNPAGDAWTISTSAPPPIPEQELPRLNEGLPIGTHRTGAYGISFIDAYEQEVWFEPAGVTKDLPLEVLEDYVVAWKVLATHAGTWFAPTLLGGQTYSTVTQAFPIVELPPHTPRVPLSRGQSCSLHAWDMSLIETLSPCPATDGLLHSIHLGDHAPRALQVSLETPATLTRMVMRAVVSGTLGLLVEAFDGTDWHLVHTEPGTSDEGPLYRQVAYSFVVEVPADLGPVQSVRVSVPEPPAEGGGSSPIGGVTEISLF